MKAIIYSFAFSHHGKHSSFHHLCDYLCDQTVLNHTFSPPSWLPIGLRAKLENYWHKYGECRLWAYYHQSTPKVIHYLRPETNMRFGWRWKRNSKLVMSCHQPVQKLAQMKGKGRRFEGFFNGLSCADTVVVLSETQIEGYRLYAPQADIKYIPMGVDTGFFSPSPTQSSCSSTILTVGSWLRDYACWAEVVRALLEKEDKINFVVVANNDAIQKARSYLSLNDERVRFLSGITDEELRGLYQQAYVLFLPLHDAVANNALLEAMATGTPPVVTELPATKEYLGDDAGVLIADHSPGAYVEGITQLISNPALWTKKSQCAIARVEEHFSWERIAEQYRSVYGSLMT